MSALEGARMNSSFAITVYWKKNNWFTSVVQVQPGKKASDCALDYFSNRQEKKCIQCPLVDATSFSEIETTLLLIESKTAMKCFVLVDHCDQKECSLAANAKCYQFIKKDASPSFLMYSCQYCRKEAPKMAKCSRCQLMRYCSQDCQRNDYPEHKQHCKKK
jgi:hypothetical protein